MINRFEQFASSIACIYRYIQKLERDEMAKYGYEYTLKVLNEVFKTDDKAEILAAIKRNNDLQQADYKPRLTVDVVLNKINVMTRKYAKRMSNWEKTD